MILLLLLPWLKSLKVIKLFLGPVLVILRVSTSPASVPSSWSVDPLQQAASAASAASRPCGSSPRAASASRKRRGRLEELAEEEEDVRTQQPLAMMPCAANIGTPGHASLQASMMSQAETLPPSFCMNVQCRRPMEPGAMGCCSQECQATWQYQMMLMQQQQQPFAMHGLPSMPMTFAA